MRTLVILGLLTVAAWSQDREPLKRKTTLNAREFSPPPEANRPGKDLSREAILTEALRMTPVTPCRVLDTRNANGPFGGPVMAANTARILAISQGPCGIPASATAFSLNVTVVPRGPLAYLAIGPASAVQSGVSTLNSPEGLILSNAALVAAGTGGAIQIFVTNTTDVIVDINAYFSTAPSGAAFFAVNPCRVMDTRVGSGKQGEYGPPALFAGATRRILIPQAGCGVPAEARAYSVNITVLPLGPLSYLTVYPTGAQRPQVSTLNSYRGRIIANAALVPAGADGEITFFVTDNTDLLLDVNGYFK